GQAGAAKGKSRLQVRGRYVQFRILAEDLHDPGTVEIGSPGYVPYLVRETDFQCMPYVIDVLRHLGLIDGRSYDRSIQVSVQGHQHVSAFAVDFPDNGFGWIVVIVNGG